jgi:hypothetical protein
MKIATSLWTSRAFKDILEYLCTLAVAIPTKHVKGAPEQSGIMVRGRGQAAFSFRTGQSYLGKTDRQKVVCPLFTLFTSVLTLLFSLFFVVVATAEQQFYKHVVRPKEMDPQLALIGPSRVQCGEPFELQVVALGKDGEPCSLRRLPIISCEGPQLSSMPTKLTSTTIEVRLAQEGIYYSTTSPTLSMAGYYLLTAQDPEGVFLPFGLPVYASSEAPHLQIYWGDLHGHSTLSDGARAPEEYYGWARNVARLDAMALVDHNWALNDEKIEKIRRLSTEWYEPGRFVPFMAFEWAPGVARPAPARGRPDHKHLLFRHTDERFTPWAPWQNTPSVKNLWEMLDGREVIAVPHHTGLPHETYYGTDWSQHSEKFERVVEIFSDWGSSEMAKDRYPLPETEAGNFVRDALSRGLHLGFVGGSDTHGSRPGLNAIPRMGHPYALTALTAIEAPELSRNHLWLALYNRCCYATSAGRRTLLDFSVDGAPMGSRIVQPVRLSSRHLAATVAGPRSINELIIVKNGEQVASFPGTGWCQQVKWTDTKPSPDREDSYYVRAEIEDTSMAWSSPIWVAGPSDSDISAAARLWRLDGDIARRLARTVNAAGTKVTSDRPLTLCELRGAGAIDRIMIDALSGVSEEDVRSAVLTVRVDGEEKPSMGTCLDQLFFVAMGGKPFATHGVGFSSMGRKDGCWLTFARDLRIPFAKSCTVQLVPAPGKILPRVRTQVTYGLWPEETLPPLGRMGKCVVRSLRGFEVKGTGTEVEVLNIKGRGFLHSLQMAMRNRESVGQYMEGNVEIYVDGEPKSSYSSSGTEEFFYGGIYFINPFWTPNGGCTLSINEPNNPERCTSAYRIFAKDPIPFDESLRIVWHNGQRGQGDVPGTTVVDAQSVVYLQREDEVAPDPYPDDLAPFAQRLSVLDGDPELGPMVTDTPRFSSVSPGDSTTLCDVGGAGHLSRLQLNLTGAPRRLARAHLIMIRDGEEICAEPLTTLFGTGGATFSFAAGVVGQIVFPNAGIHLQRELLVPYSKSLKIQLAANEESGSVEGLAVIERRVARGGLPSDFGCAQAPLLLHGSCTASGKRKIQEIVNTSTEMGGEVSEISIAISNLTSGTLEIPGKLSLKCDGEIRAAWTPQELAAPLDNGAQGVRTIPGVVCVREERRWSALVSMRNTPFRFSKSVGLSFDTTGLPDETRVEAHLIVGRGERGAKRMCSAREIAQRLTAIDGGVLGGRAICRTVLENGVIEPGKSATLLDLPAYGTLRCIRIGTPFSALALRRSHLSITFSAIKNEPTINTPTDHLFATWFDPFPFWEGAETIVRPSQLHREKGGDHTSAFRLLNLPFHGRCRVVLSAPKDDGGAMEWLKKHMPEKTLQEVLLGDVTLPENVRQGLVRCADVGLFVQVYANRLDRTMDWGRWAMPHFASVEGEELQPGGELTLVDIRGRGVLQGLQLAFENPQSAGFERCSILVFVDDEPTAGWTAPDLGALFLGTPIPGSGEGKQVWEDESTRGRNARGAGKRLMSPEAGTTIFTSTSPYRLGGVRNFTRDAISFEKSLRILCRHPAGGEAPTRVWSLALLSLEEGRE